MPITLIFTLAVEAALLWWALRRSGFMPFPHGFMVYIMGAQVFLYLNAADLVFYDFLQMWALRTGAYQIYWKEMNFLLAAFFAASAFCVPSTHVDLRKAITTVGFKPGPYEDAIHLGIIVVLYLRLFIHWSVLDWGLVWSNDEYLAMNNYEGQSAAGSLVSQTARIFGALTVLLATYLYGRKHWAALFAVLPLVAWHVLYDMASHQRAVAYYFIAAMLALMVLRPNHKLGWATMGGLGALTLLGSLAGRGSGFHGFASLPYYFVNIFSTTFEIGDLSNVFEGAFTTAEFFGRDIHYNPIYARLSLSPFVSMIDGFDSIRPLYEQRPHPYVPHSAVTEVLSFGPTYAALFFAVEFAACWLSARLLARDQSLFAVCLNSLVLLACYLSFTYAARTVFRLLFWSGVAAGFFWLRSSRKAKAEAPVFLKPAGGPRRAQLAAMAVDLGEARAEAAAMEHETPQERRRRRAAEALA